METITIVNIDGTVTTRDMTPEEQAQFEESLLATAWAGIRVTRDSLLVVSDWTQLEDAPVDHAAWAVYRQQLRDMPEHTTDPLNPVWPTPPAGQ